MPSSFSTSTSNTTLSIDGLFLYRKKHGTAAAKEFLNDFLAGNEKFDEMGGSFFATIEYPEHRKIYFSDNSGMRRYFINWKERRFSKTFIEALPEKVEPNFLAIAQFLWFGCVYGQDTIENSVQRNNPNSYYVLTEEGIEEKSKRLTPLEKIEVDEEILAGQMKILSDAMDDYKKYSCTITGGVDSRAILSHVLYNNLKPVLNITGSSDHIDVVIAKEIAKKTGLELLTISDVPEENWLDETISAAQEGCIGVCGAYRLYKKSKLLKELGIEIDIGGLAGELYKNSFINQDFPFYFGKPNWDRFLQFKVMTFDFSKRFVGDSIKESVIQMKDILSSELSDCERKTKASSYLLAGYGIMQARSAGLSTMQAQRYINYSPLLERNVAAYGFQRNPYNLEMQAFQREQTTKYYPALKDIRTDRGLTADSKRKNVEWLKSMTYLSKVAAQRVFARNKAKDRIDACFEEGLHSQQFARAFDRCKILKILPEELDANQLPLGIADRAFTVGSIL